VGGPRFGVDLDVPVRPALTASRDQESGAERMLAMCIPDGVVVVI